jgi:hypothetical protein
MILRMRRSLIVIVVIVLTVVAAGCGSDDPPASTASVNQIQSFADQQLGLRLDDNQSADPFVCEEDGDAQHWTCTTEVQTDSPDDANADEPVPLTVNVTCDENGSCTYEPET